MSALLRYLPALAALVLVSVATVGGFLEPLDRLFWDPIAAAAAPGVAPDGFLLVTTDGLSAEAVADGVKRIAAAGPRLVVSSEPLPGIDPAENLVVALAIERGPDGALALAGETGRQRLPLPSGAGIARVEPGPDGRVRSTRLWFTLEGVRAPSIEAAALSRLSNAPVEREALEPSFVGPGGSFPRIGLQSLASGAVGIDVVAGRIVLVGRADAAEVALHATAASGGANVPPLEIHASVLADLLAGTDLSRSRAGVHVALLLLAAGTVLAARRIGPGWAAGLALGSAIAWTGFSALARARLALLVPAAPVMTLALLLGAWVLLEARRIAADRLARAVLLLAGKGTGAAGPSPRDLGEDSAAPDILRRVLERLAGTDVFLLWGIDSGRRFTPIDARGEAAAAVDVGAWRPDRSPFRELFAGSGPSVLGGFAPDLWVALGVPLGSGGRKAGVWIPMAREGGRSEGSPFARWRTSIDLARTHLERRLERLLAPPPGISLRAPVESRLLDLDRSLSRALAGFEALEGSIHAAAGGTVLFDLFGRPLFASASARRAFGADVAERGLAAVGAFARMNLAESFLSVATQGRVWSARVDRTAEEARTWQVSMQRTGQGVLVELADVTELAELSRLRQEVLSTLGLESRQRVRRVLSLCDEARSRSGREFAEDLGSIRAGVEEIASLFDQLSETASRTGAIGAKSRVRGPVDAVEILGGLAADLERRLAGRRVEIHREIPESVRVLGDPSLLRRGLAGLLDFVSSNTPDGSWIRIAIELEADAARITLSNRGYGLTAEAAAGLLDGSTATRAPGVPPLPELAHGIRRSGGEVALSSELGQGLTFHVRLPLFR